MIEEEVDPEIILPAMRKRNAGEQVLRLLEEELKVWQTKCHGLEQTNVHLKGLLGEYEENFENLKNKDLHAMCRQQQRNALMQAEADHEATRVTFHNLKQRYEEMKREKSEFKAQEGILKARLADLQSENATLERRFDNLRKHAEAKLEEAQKELQSQKDRFETELTALRGRVQMLEIGKNRLEESNASLKKNRDELSALCDELLRQIENPNK